MDGGIEVKNEILRNLQAIFSNTEWAAPYHGDVLKQTEIFKDSMDPQPSTSPSMQLCGACVPWHCASIGSPTARKRFRGGNLAIIG